MEEAMDVTGPDPANSDHEEQETSVVRHGEGGKRGRYSYTKCSICRKKKKKCDPPDRVWPSKCNRCLGLGLDCSPPEDSRTTGLLSISTQGSRVDGGKITKPYKTPTATTSSSGSPPNTARPLSPKPGIFEAIAGQPALPLGQKIHPLGLCPQCQRLEISSDRFLIPDRSRRANKAVPGQRLTGRIPGLRLPTQSANNTSVNAPEHSRFSWGSHEVEQHVVLGTLRDIRRESAHCKLCLLIWQSADDQLVLAGEDPNRLDQFNQDSLRVHATWEIDGRELIPFANKVFYQPVTRHIRISWEGDSEDFRPNDAYIVLCPDNPNMVGLDPAFLGRKVDLVADRGLDYNRMRAWIKHCDVHHGSCRHHTLLQTVPLRLGEELRVLDLESLKLVPMEEGMEYVVLSYTWSDNKHLLKRHLYEPWRTDGLKEDDLEQDVRTAVHLMRKLEKRYLWVDSLCVFHDDLGDRNRHFPIMERIFANASLTICVTHLVRPSQALRQHTMSYDSKMSLVVHHPLETYIRDSTWAKGAWTCQDRLLSTRCLIVSTDLGRAWFQCQEESMSQDVYESSYQGYSADMVHNPVKIWNELNSPRSKYRAYIKCVELYTTRRLPVPGHALRAFEGISNFLSASFDTRFFRGLPSRYLDMALLWTSVNNDAEQRTFHGRPVAPSWSWASWTGGVTYRAPFLTGAVENIYDWLKEHTWITWYLADSEGRLGQIGTFAKGQLETRAEGRELSTPLTDDGKTVPLKRETRWPSRNQTEFFTEVVEPVGSPNRMESDELDIIGRPYFLQFWTWSAHFHLSPAWIAQSTGQFPTGRKPPPPNIRRFDILDCNGDICGSIVLPNEFADRVETEEQEGKTRTYEFVALSDAKEFRLDEMPEWTYYIPKKREDSFWDLAYVLLIEKDERYLSRRVGHEKLEMGVSKRVGLGKVFSDAFHQSFQPGMEWREFILA
ncbi:Heterokaryon incompatibility protein (HET) domain containing protein [Naviculisporaceae sp. PSN 640]